jgi:membrane peptidoglycan carboxypeptidase
MPTNYRKSDFIHDFTDNNLPAALPNSESALEMDYSLMISNGGGAQIDSKLIDDAKLYLENDLILDPELTARHKILRKGSKISTEFNHNSETDEELYAYQNRPYLGKKEYAHDDTSLYRLKRRFGFSWNKFGRKVLMFGTIFGLLIILAFSVVATWAVDIWYNTPTVDSLDEQVQSSIVYARDGITEIAKYFDEIKRTIIPITEIPKHTQLAVIALEDKDFYNNESGIPWKNLIGASFKCFTSGGDECRGASGLSQQFIKNYTGDQKQDISRKVRELFTAIKLNQEKDKSEIITLYFNQVPFGRNAYGIEEAAQSYFGKHAKDLTLTESCYLAPMVNQPTYYAGGIGKPDSDAYKDLEFKKNLCIDNLRTLQLTGTDSEPFIKTDAEADAFKSAPVVWVDQYKSYPYPHFRNFVRDEVAKLGITERDLNTKGFKIISTIDPIIQQKTEESIAETYDNYIKANGANNAAAMVLDGPTGEILSMVGSVDYNNKEIDGQVNNATAPQQPGSSYKPYAYAAAIEQGFNPGTMIFEATQDYGNYKPKNYSNKSSFAPISMRNGLQNSYNTTALRMAFLAAGEGKVVTDTGESKGVLSRGVENMFNFSEKVGLRYPCVSGYDNYDNAEGQSIDWCKDPKIKDKAYKNRCSLSAAIGGCEISMVSHITGINTLAQDGNLRTATPFISVFKSDPANPNNKIDVYKNNVESATPAYPKRDRVIDPGISKQMMNMMSDYKARYREFCGGRTDGCDLARNLQLEGWDGPNAVAAKTGTTDQVKDTWTVGATPYYTVTTWVGNTKNEALNNDAAASSAAAPVWNSIMVKIHESKEKKGFNTDGLQATKLNAQTGLPDENGSVTEFLTVSQLKILEEAQKRLNTPGYNPATEGIFNNRSVVVGRNFSINTADGKLATEGKTLPKNIASKFFYQAVPEFPSQPWIGIANNYSSRLGFAPNEYSVRDEVADSNARPSISTNIASNTNAPTSIVAKSEVTGDKNKKIAKTEILVDGSVVATGESEASFDTNGKTGSHTITLRATDSNGITSEAVISNLVFGKIGGGVVTP